MRWVVLAAYLLKEMVVSTLSVAWLVVQPRLKLRPAIIAYPLSVTTDLQITLLANMITLTPGTLSVDVVDNGRTLLIHALDVPDRERLIGSIAAGFETAVLRATR